CSRSRRSARADRKRRGRRRPLLPRAPAPAGPPGRLRLFPRVRTCPRPRRTSVRPAFGARERPTPAALAARPRARRARVLCGSAVGRAPGRVPRLQADRARAAANPCGGGSTHDGSRREPDLPVPLRARSLPAARARLMATPLALALFGVLIAVAAVAVWRRPLAAIFLFVVGLAAHNLVMSLLWGAGVRGDSLELIAAWKEILLAVAAARVVFDAWRAHELPFRPGLVDALA